MKKIYSFFLLVIGVLCGTPASAQVELVTSVEDALTSLEGLQEGDKVMFYECGEEARRGFLAEGDNQSLWIRREFTPGKSSSADFVWTLVSVTHFEDGVTVKLKSPRGNYLPNFAYFPNARPKWPGMTCLSEDSIAEYTIVSAGKADTLFYVRDENNVFFNAQGFLSGQNYGKFVGWNAEGDNSLYVIHPIKTEVKTSIPTNFYYQDVDGVDIQDMRESVSIIGSEITAPTIENYSFVRAENYDDGSEIELPFKVTSFPEEGELNIAFIYEQYPLVSISLEDENGEVLKAWDQYIEKGTRFHASDYPLGIMGYELLPSQYDDYEITESTEVHITYRKNNTAGLPFKPTTIDGGALAADTHYYLMTIRGGYVYHKTGENAAKVVNSINSDSIDSYLWAFVGNVDEGITIYNKELGASGLLFAASTENKTPIQFGTSEEAGAEGAEGVFNITFNNDGATLGYAFSAKNEPTACFNRFGGATGENLCFWTNGSSPTDVGSRIVFRELTEDEINAYAFASSQQLLNTENCVGGYTSAQLATLKSAVAAGDLSAAKAASAALEGAETIAFDANKSYYLVSAFKNFIINQPGKTFAVQADATDTLRWNELGEEQMNDDHYKWEFYAASDSTYYIGNVAAARAIASFRFGESVVLEGVTAVDTTSTDTYPEGVAAPFQMVSAPVSIAPAAFYLVHTYGTPFVTLSASPVNNSTITNGSLISYNTRTLGYNNVWRLKEAGAFTNGITSNEVAKPVSTAVYDLSGRRVNNAQKGIYIMGGQKVLVK